MPPATIRSDRVSRPARVAEAIRALVEEQNLRPGDRLPGEQALIDRFGMAKGTIREAIRLLEAEGMVKTRTGPGGGVFVHEPSEHRAAALLHNYFYFKDLTVDDIYRLRIQLEPECAAGLAGRLSPDQLEALERVVERYATPPADAEEERAQHIASLEFHRLLASYSDNPLLSFLIRFMATMLSEITVSRRLYEPRNFDLWKKGVDHQRDLVAALRRGDGAAARAISEAHMRGARDLMLRQEAEMARRFLQPR